MILISTRETAKKKVENLILSLTDPTGVEEVVAKIEEIIEEMNIEEMNIEEEEIAEEAEEDQ